MQIMLIGMCALAALLFIALIVLFFISRKSQKTMESLLLLMTNPERAKIRDAANVLHTILADEMKKIDDFFHVISSDLNDKIATANSLKEALIQKTLEMNELSENTTKKMVIMSQRLDNTLNGLSGVVSSQAWQDIDARTQDFTDRITHLLDNIDSVTKDTEQKTNNINTQLDSWIQNSETLSNSLENAFNNNSDQIKKLIEDSEVIENKIASLTNNATNGFNEIKTSAANYENVLNKNNNLVKDYLNNLSDFSKESKKQLTNQMNTLTNTANVVAGQIRLSESSIERQVRALTDAVDFLMKTAADTEASVRNLSSELAALTNRFNGEIKDFATSVVSELKTVSGVANTTLENTKTAAGAFSDSVRTMATSVRETLMEMNTAHTQLSGQSANLIKMSAETTAQLKPLSELIEKYYSALPDLSSSSLETNDNLERIVAGLNEKINLMKTTVAESTAAIAESAGSLENLAGQSRQQMIDLMSDYAKAVNTMQTLNKQMMVARATAPMDAINTPPISTFGKVSSQDFLKQSEKLFEKMHEQSMDLTKAIGAEIPDVVWKKYHAGDKTIFSKWLAKILNAADKKKIRDLLKSDAVFRSQASQFVHGFDKVLTSAKQADNSDALSATILKTELGQIYIALKGHV